MPHADFVHLHVKSAYSLSEGAIHIKELASLCVQNDIPALALIDSGNMFGALDFSETMMARGVQPIVGCAITLRIDPGESGLANGKNGNSAQASHWLEAPIGLLVQNQAGYQNLIKLSSAAFLEPDAGDRPHLTLEQLAARSEGLICLSGGGEGPLGRLLVDGQTAAAGALAGRLAEIYRGRCYIEIQRHGSAAEAASEAGLLDLAYSLELPLVATNGVYFADPRMHEAHDALLCIAAGTTVSDEQRRKLTSNHCFKSAAEMRALFADLPEAADNTLVVARRCAFQVETREPILPRFGDRQADEATTLQEKAAAGLEDRLARRVIEQGMDDPAREEVARPYRERLAYELDVIVEMGFAGYFLIVADFIHWARDNDVPVGPGRGSGAGSVVAWSLKITDLDPLRFGLLFERFLNPGRVSMPDFDIDFCQEKRDRVIHYVQQKYGTGQVAQIITFGKLQARAVLRDVGRVLELPYGLVDRLCKMVPNNPANPTSLGDAIKTEPRLQEARRSEPGVDRLLDIALKLEGLYRHASTHAAGVVIGDRPLDELIPLYRDPRSEMPVTQFNMKWVELAGLVKFDFLGLKTLTVLDRAVGLLKQRGVDIDIDDLPLEDAATFELIASGNTIGIFQLEGSGMRDMLRKMHPDTFEDIIAVVSLYRPGPMDNIPRFINVKHGTEEADYLHEWLEPILKETYGVIVYQEQVMQIAQTLADYSLGDADLLRRAMGKKIKSEMDAQRTTFMERAIARGVEGERASYIFDLVAKFAGYGFNKSHAAAYALVAFQTAYLKANFPIEFMAASMTLDLGNTDKLNLFRQELDRMGITLLGPDINKSGVEFAVEQDDTGQGTIRYALAAIRNVGREAMRANVAERTANGPFKDIWDFAGRVDPRQFNKRQFENLARAGAFDSLRCERAALVGGAELLIRYAQQATESRNSAQVSLFGDAEGDLATPPPNLPDVPAWPAAELLAHEFEAVGFYLSAHPLDAYEQLRARQKIKRYSEALEAIQRGATSIRMAGTVLRRQDRKSAKGNPFAFIQLSDQSGMFEVTAFREILASSRELLEPGRLVVMSVSAELREDQPRFTLQSVEDIEQAALAVGGGIKLFVKQAEALPSIRTRLADTAPGRGKVALVIELEDQASEVELAISGSFALSPAVRGALKAIPGVIDVHDF